MTGRVTRIPTDRESGKRRGFCFVAGDDGLEYFLHASSIKRGKLFADVQEGDTVDFQPSDGERGLRAEDARVDK